MRKTILMSFLALFLLAGTAAAVVLQAPEVPAADEVVLPGTESPAEAEGQPEAAPEVSTETPEPLFLCLAGWCSNDRQCQEWYNDPDARCVKGKGHTCGQCGVAQ